MALRTAPPVYNGAWIFTDSSTVYSWDAPKTLFLPRVGLAWRINNNTALRIGWARYVVPAALTDSLNILGSVPYPGFDATSTTIAPLLGVPQQRLSDSISGWAGTRGGQRLSGDTPVWAAQPLWYQQDFSPGVNDRYSFNVQRELPGRVVADITFFMNIGRSAPYTFDLNQIDPRIGYSIGNAVNQTVANPFFNVLPPREIPWPVAHAA